MSASHRRRVHLKGRDALLDYGGLRATPEPPTASRPTSEKSRERMKPAAAAAPDSRRASARSMGGRPSVVASGTRRRRRLATAAIVAVSAIVLAALAGAGWWFATRPAGLTLTATPADAVIAVDNVASASGRVTTSSLDPGVYHATIGRSGFETATVTLTLRRGEHLNRAVALKPLPFKLKFSSRPKGAAITVSCPDGTKLTGTAPCEIVAPAGQTTVTMTMAKFNSFERGFFLDSAQAFDVLLDPKGQVVHALGSLATKGAPKGCSVTPDGREVWTSILNGPPSIEIFDLHTLRKTAGVNIGKYGAVEIIFNRAGTLAYASQMETAKVFEIDVATRTVKRSFATDSSWTKVIALSPDEKTLYAANWSGNDVSIIDLASGDLVKRVRVAKTPRGLWPTSDGRYLYVAGFDKGEIQRIDLETYKVRTLFKSGGAMRHFVADESTGKLYASDMGKDTVWVLDMKTLKTRKFCTTDHKPNTIDLSPDGRVLFVSNRGENNPKTYYIPGYEWGTILLFDTATGRPLDAVVGGNQCTALDVSGDARTLVFSDFLDNRLRVYAVPDYATLAKGGGGRFAAHFADLKKKRP